ncbi:glycosyltransferase family 4 protein [Flavobacterium collinsii]|jgi:glycosyltransferase involved in cell wall biosynthesis|uniref:glycosyltransferase family 4 protein n=1 Tax=Flavobacterium collinsii TaxID=1114861 RepID=UPI003757C6F2
MKLLILTSEYPNPNSSFDTPVVHYYAKEWVQLGHEVRVVHFRSVFPTIFYSFAKILKTFLKKIFQTDFIPFVRLNKRVEFVHEGINVVSQPIFKIFPHFKFFNSTIRKQAKIIYTDNLHEKFQPDIIISHFVNPQLPLITELKKYYPAAKTSLVLHENPKVISDLFGSKASQLLANLDYIGFRFDEMRNVFFRMFGERNNTFICPSGIPENYILSETPKTKFAGEKISICFVGMLIPLKNIDILLEAVNLAFPDRNFTLEILGEGMLNEKISQKITELKLEGCVTMLGKLSRDEVQEKMINNDIFVMVSKPEAFGLVYVEAMSKGCITIGTIGQGIDGVIKHGENGFLCEARNVETLKNLFIEINQMSYEDKMRVATKAIETASSLTDSKVALDYLKKITINNN